MATKTNTEDQAVPESKKKEFMEKIDCGYGEWWIDDGTGEYYLDEEQVFNWIITNFQPKDD